MILREAEMTPAVFEWLSNMGLVPYTEVSPPLWMKGIDVVGWDGVERVVAVEMKVSLTKALRWQGSLCQTVTREAYCAVRSRPRSEGIEACRRWGLGLLRVADGRVLEILAPGKMRSRPIYEPRATGLIERLRKMKPGGVGGVPSLKGVGPARDVRGRVLAYLLEHPDATWEDMYNSLENHYAHWRSMRTAQKALEEVLEKDGDLDGAKIFGT